MALKTYKIAVTSVSFSKNIQLKEGLRKTYPNSKFNENGIIFKGQELIDYLSDSDGVIVGLEPITKEVIDALPNIKIWSKYGVGLDNIDTEYLKQKGIPVGWKGGVNRRSVSELALCFLLGLSRNIFFSGYPLKSGRWEKNGGFELTGKTVGIVGCGFIGEDLLRLLQPFHCKILIHDIVDKSDIAKFYGANLASFEEVCRESDFITMHVPLTDLTKGMINEKSISFMKESAYLINTSRGPIVNQTELKKALQTKKIAGAALDVFIEEPPTDIEFLSLPNLMVTPHIGGNAREAVLAMGNSAIHELGKVLK